MTDEVIFERHGGVGIVQLNRPKALNALNINMIGLLTQQYKTWSEDMRVKCFLIKGSPKAYCAGGDVKTCVMDIRNGNPELAKRFFHDEYRFNHQLATLSKPNIAFIDGITMGGGAGISINGQFRVATERTVFAMPETAIGFFPDVGASYFLNKLPGFLGTYLGVTGARLKGFQVLEAGLATHFVSSEQLPGLEKEIIGLEEKAGNIVQLERLLSAFQEASKKHAKPTGLLQDLDEINTSFQHDSMEGISAAVEQFQSPWAREAKILLSKGSKMSQKFALRLIRKGQDMSLANCLKMEYTLAANIADKPQDFDEGIRAVLIDKDSKPQWKPPELEQVTQELVDSFFATLLEGESLEFQDSYSKL